jgi:hypothetical protein
LREFFDSSVLIAAFWGGHANHGASIQCLNGANKKHSSCGIHSLAEVYAVMSFFKRFRNARTGDLRAGVSTTRCF